MSASDLAICTATALLVFIMSTSCIHLAIKYMLHLRSYDGIKQQTMSSFISWISNVCFAFTGILILAQMIALFITPDKNTTFQVIARRASMFLYLSSGTLMILAFTFRVDLTFKHSTFRYSARTIKTLYISVSLLVCLFVLTMIVSFLQTLVVLILIGVLWCLMYVGLCITLTVLFTRKMDQVIMEYMRNMEKSEVSQSEPATVDTLIDEELLYIVIKHGLLVPIAIISSFVTFVLAVFMQYASGWTFLSAFLYVFDSFVSGICIYLLFSFNRRVYDVVCGPLHRLCKRCKLWQMKGKFMANDPTMPGDPSLECAATNSNQSETTKSQPAGTDHDVIV